MTRKSRREIERALEELDDEPDEPLEIVIRRQVVKTGWSDERDEHPDAEPGDVIEETEKVIEI